MLSSIKGSSPALTRRGVALLLAAGLLACAIPTLHLTPMLSAPEAAAAEAGSDAPQESPKVSTLRQWENLTDEEADAITVRHLRALAIAVHVYADDHDGQLPPPAVPNAALPPEKRLSGLVLLLPYLGKRPSYIQPEDWQKSGLADISQEALFNAIDLTKAWDDPANVRIAKTVVPVFVSPRGGPLLDENGYSVSHFAFVRGADGEDDGAYPEGGGIVFWPPPEDKTRMLRDGSVNTLGIGQIQTDLGPWTAAGPSTSRYVCHPSDNVRAPTFGSIHDRACYFATCDAATHFVDMANIDRTVLRHLAARADGHPIDWRRLQSVYRNSAEWKATRDEPGERK